MAAKVALDRLQVHPHDLKVLARVLGLLLMICAGCAPAGGARYAHLSTYDAPGGEYRIRYLSPPWQLDEELTEGGDSVFFIEANAASFVSFDVELEPKYLLHVSLVPGTADELANVQRSQSESADETILVPAREVTTDAGDTGTELVAELPEERTRYRRYVFLDRAEGQSVRLEFEATPDLDEIEVDDMIASVVLDPQREAE